jgi:hypothetical protein
MKLQKEMVKYYIFMYSYVELILFIKINQFYKKKLHWNFWNKHFELM